MILDDAQLELSRKRPQQTKLNLFVFEPKPVLKCLVNSSSIAKGARTIPFDNVSLGSYSDVLPNMTVLVGLTEGGEEVGRVRLRSCTVDQMVVGENSDIKWADGLHLTVLKFWEVWPIFPRIIQNPSNPTDVIFYKDYDIPHVNQNNVLGAFVNPGLHQGVLLESGTGSVYYDASTSQNLVGAGMSYQWSFESGTPATSVAETPGWVNYHTPGDYVTSLVVTNANGSVDTAYRYISVRNKIGEGSNTPIVKWAMGDFTESRSSAGGSIEFTVFDKVNLMEGAVVILTTEDWYGNTKQSLGGNVQNSENIFFVGFVDRGSISYSAFDSSVTFTASNITEMLKRATGFSISVESKPAAVRWYELLDMDIRRAIYHYLRWHSTALSLADFHFVGDDRKIQFFDADRGSLFDAVDNLMRGTLFGTFCSDRQGSLWAEVEPQSYDDPTGTFTPVMEITRQDWKDRPSVEDRYYDESSYVELGGIAYSGAITGTFSAHLADAPGGSPARTGNVDTSSGLALTGQTQLNSLVGHVWANKNSQYPSISMGGAVGLRNLGVAPYEVVHFDLAPEDTVKGKRVEGLYYPSSVTWRYRPQDQILLPDITFSRLVNGDPGDTIIIPAQVPDGGFGYDFPSFDFPDFPAFLDIPTLSLYDPQEVSNVVIGIKDQGVYYTTDFNSPYPSWYPMNVGLPGLDGLRQLEVSATGKLYYQHSKDSIWVAPQLGSVWTSLFNYTMIGNPGGYPFPRDQLVDGFAIDRHQDDVLAIFASVNVTIFGSIALHMWKGGQSGVALVPNTAPAIHFEMAGAERLAFVTKGENGWLITFQSGLSGKGQLISDNGEVINDWAGASGNTVIHTRSLHAPLTAMNLYHPYITRDDGATWQEISGSPGRYGQSDPGEFQSIITNADGTQIVVGTYDVAIPSGLVYSLDSGSSWLTGSFSPTGTWGVTSVWHLDDSAYIISAYEAGSAGSTRILVNYDLPNQTGTFWVDKTGNLGNYITGTYYPMMIRHYYGE